MVARLHEEEALDSDDVSDVRRHICDRLTPDVLAAVEMGQERDEALASATIERTAANEWLAQLHDARRERDEARGLLVEVRDVLALCTTRAFTAPEDAEVRALGMRIGFGALMSAASKGWADLLSERYPEAVGAHHTTGPCEATVQCMLAKLDEHLEESK